MTWRQSFWGRRSGSSRIGTDGSVDRAESAIREWEPKADVIGLGMVQDHYQVGTHKITHEDTRRLEEAVQSVPVTTGATLRGIPRTGRCATRNWSWNIASIMPRSSS